MSKFKELTTAMGNHSLSEFPLEACGIITLDYKYLPCKNLSRSPKNSFVVDPISIIANIENIWGFYHSHPGSSDPIPSIKDMGSAAFTEYSFIVGFGTKFYIYWLEDNSLKFEIFNENHLTLPTADK
jgi:proteasome lid subunit RPN8/RPN11